MFQRRPRAKAVRATITESNQKQLNIDPRRQMADYGWGLMHRAEIESARVALLQAPDRRFGLLVADHSSLPPAISIPGFPLGAVKAILLSASSAGNEVRWGFRDGGN